MENLPDRQWHSIYESQPSGSNSYLVDEFYVPALKRSVRYDRIAGYFSSSALAVASRGIDALLENDGEMRLVVGTELYTTDRPVFEALADELTDSLDELEDEQLDAQLQLLARLLREDRLHIKVAVPRQGSWRIFHPKMGIFHDDDDNALSFEGSVNETVGGWKNNYERFKVHRSWVDQQSTYVDDDINTFDRLWKDEHPYVEVYDLPEAIEEELIDWKDPDSQSKLEEAIQIVRGEAPPTERDKANIISDGHLSPGGLALAEEGSTITPWPHQRVVSDTLVNTYPNSFLLCDEVGLGKTIEAGLTLSRLGLTDELETGLLLVPASLSVQWQEEMWEKFNLNTYRYERGSDYEYAFIDVFGREHSPPAVSELDISEGEREQAWVSSPIWRFLHEHQDAGATSGPAIVIMSWHTARLRDRWNQVAPKDGSKVRTRDDVPASCRGRSPTNREGVWDAVIVDEAHNGRKGSSFYSMLEQLRDHTQTYYLLTATPMQLHAGELYDLMSLLDLPGEWDNQNDFVDFFETRRALKKALSESLNESDSSGDSWSAQATLTEGRYQDRISGDRSLSARVFDSIAAELDVGDERNARSIAKQRVLRACDLASDYGEYYDGYIERFEASMDENGVDPFDAKEDEKLKYLLYPEWKTDEEWLTYSRNDRLAALDELSESGWRVIQDILSESTPVDALIHRNTRDTLRKYERVGLLDATVPDREPEQHKISLTEETREVYDRIDDYTRKFYKLAQQSDEAESRAIGFVMTTYRQRLTSSIYAISQSLQNRVKKLRKQRTVLRGKKRVADQNGVESKQTVMETLDEYDLEEDDDLDELERDLEDVDLAEIIPNVTDEGLYLLDQEIEELESFVDELAGITQDPKINQLKDDLDELDREGHTRAIIFTQYADTMDFIRDSLISIHGETVATYSGRGGEMFDRESRTWVEVGKERVKREFAADDGQVDILVCTDSASEGLNLQECGALINYDLPWNPMRVEQRIGRIDRIGQEFPEVTILNYSYEDTVETDIYERLDTRIGLFENVVGEMQPILSGVSKQIRSATLETERSESREAVERADKEFSEEIGKQEQSDRIDVGESLESVDGLVEQDVIDEAKLDAWQSYRHPDITDVGDEEYEFDAPFGTSGLKAVLTQNETLAGTGIRLTPLRELDVDLSEFDGVDEFNLKDELYRLECSEFDLPQVESEQTLAEAVAPGQDAVAVTFSTECGDEYSSVHYLAPGNPILDQLIRVLRESSEDVERLTKQVEERETGTGYPLVCGWGRDGHIMTIDADGSTDDSVTSDSLTRWFDMFLENRDPTSTTS
ncbi:helicase-related protein [Haloferax larsenii]|uniref:Superfamily II DNA or RNA helicase, SNF2 family n=1 Tax=Haloferax larsenii TaxID=302484 RepID=A0A1H7TUX2_HALLR|nr:helicase-related protein [Haloferax larsenii]SEL88453.1 Superfamily II DNA or RNA helicase, SNF2 family [Haloferax larsenii]